MSLANCLDSLIHEVDAATQATQPGTRRIVVDINRRSAVNSDWFRPAASLKYFLVSTVEVVQCQTSIIHIDQSGRSRAIGFKVDLSVRCSPGNEAQVAESLCGDPNPSTVLTNQIRQWVHEYLSQQSAAFFDNFLVTKFELASDLATRAMRDTGLDMSAEISLSGGDEVAHSSTYGPVDLEVQLRDGPPRRINLRVDLVTSHLIDVVAYRGDFRVEDLVEQSTRRYFRESVPLSQFYERHEDVSSGLRDYLNESLKIVGQRVQNLELKSDEDVPGAPFRVQEHIEYQVPGYPEPISARGSAEITVQDYATYLYRDAPNLAEWFASSLNQALVDAVAGKTHRDVMLETEPLVRDIRNKISFKAASIGCGIQQQVTLTSPTIEVWRQTFEVVVEDSFATAFQGLAVEMKIVTAAMLRQPADVNSFVARGLNLIELLETKINNDVREALLTIPPEQLYARFTLQASAGEGQPVKAFLTRRIREMLSRDFNAEVISISIQYSYPDFLKRIDELRSETISFEAELFSHTPQNRSPFIYYFDCQIEDITKVGWEMLSASAFDINKLKTQLVNAIKSGLETHDDLDLAYFDNEAAQRVKSEIIRLVTEYAQRHFGLLIKVRNVRRKPTEAERRTREAALENELARIDSVRKLEKHVLQLIANGAKQEEISQWQNRIDLIRNYNWDTPKPVDHETWPASLNQNGSRAGVSAMVEETSEPGAEPRTSQTTQV